MSTENRDLIAEARAAVEGHAPTESEVVAYRLADALEAAERHIEENREEIDRLMSERDSALHLLGTHTCGENIETAYKRAVRAEDEAKEAWCIAAEYKSERDAAEKERDAHREDSMTGQRVHAHWQQKAEELAAVVEKVREQAEEWQSLDGEGPRTVTRNQDGESISRILASAPDDVLREVKADVWDEGGADEEWNHEHRFEVHRGTRKEIKNPYRQEREETKR